MIREMRLYDRFLVKLDIGLKYMSFVFKFDNYCSCARATSIRANKLASTLICLGFKEIRNGGFLTKN